MASLRPMMLSSQARRRGAKALLQQLAEETGIATDVVDDVSA